MANGGTQNLKSLAERTTEEQREIAQKGGVASGEARRKKKLFRECFETLLEKQVVGVKEQKNLAKLGIDTEDMTNKMLVTAAMIQKAVKGNVEAYKEIKKTIGEDNTPNQDHLDKLDEVLSKIGGNI